MAPKPYTLDKVAIRMVKEPPLYSEKPVANPDDAVRLMAEMLKGYDREVFCIVNFRNDMYPINMNIVSMGTLNASLVHPREILKSPILSNAAHVMAFHNHPTGSLTPSQEDIQTTDRIERFSGYLTTMDSSAYMQNFGSIREQTDWLKEVSGKSDFWANLEISANDRVISLSTCAYRFENARYVLHGKLVELR